MTKIEKVKEEKPQAFPTIIEIYQKSIIDWDEYMEALTIISVKTSNNFKMINKQPYHNFISISRYLNKYIEAENSQTQNTETENPIMEKSRDMMNNAKNMLKPGSLPKMPK